LIKKNDDKQFSLSLRTTTKKLVRSGDDKKKITNTFALAHWSQCVCANMRLCEFLVDTKISIFFEQLGMVPRSLSVAQMSSVMWSNIEMYLSDNLRRIIGS
jgi:hypothetical protein